MKLVTRFEAATLSTPELYGLRKEAFIAFTAAPRGSQEQREALATMRTIEDELATRAPGSDKGFDGVLTGYVGPNAFNAFLASGIKLFVGASSQDTVKEALAKFNKGEYNEASAPSEVPPCEPGGGRGLGRGMGRGMGRGRGRCRWV